MAVFQRSLIYYQRKKEVCIMAKVSKSQLIALQKKLTTDEAIGKKFGITRQAIHQLRNKYGIASNYANNPVRNKKIISLYKKGTSGTAIADKTGLSVSQTYRIINTAGKKR
jgi:DNA invertase Pin-like site-specific DNA recombinase